MTESTRRIRHSNLGTTLTAQGAERAQRLDQGTHRTKRAARAESKTTPPADLVAAAEAERVAVEKHPVNRKRRGAQSGARTGSSRLGRSSPILAVHVGLNADRADVSNVLTPGEIGAMGRRALSIVGGKNYNGAILNNIPGVHGAGFRAVTAAAYDRHLDERQVNAAALDAFLEEIFANTDFRALAEAHGNAFQQDFVFEKGREFRGRPVDGPGVSLREYIGDLIGRAKRELANEGLGEAARSQLLRRLSISAQVAILGVGISPDLRADIQTVYGDLCEAAGKHELDVAVRSSAVGEDSDDAAFAGAQDTYLNISGADDVAEHVQRNFASGFNVRALEYRLSQIEKEVDERGTSLARALEKFDFDNIAVSVMIQQMIRSQKSGTAFSVDPASGMPGTVAIDSNFGYGESVVGGRVTPDNYLVTKNGKLIVRTLGDKTMMVVNKPGGGTQELEITDERRHQWVLSDEEIRDVAAQVLAVEAKYCKFMDTEFAIDDTGIYLVQARPETKHNEQLEKAPGVIPMRRLEVPEKALAGGVTLVRGDGASGGAATGTVHFITNIHDEDVIAAFKKGDILVAERTDPDFLSLFRLAGAVVANVGGRTSHAAITAREFGIPAVIGVGDLDALKALDGRQVTVDGTRGAVYADELDKVSAGEDIDTRALAALETQTSVGLVLADIDQAKRMHDLAHIPDFKVGLLRAEFVLGSIGKHYKALKAYDAGIFQEAIALFAEPEEVRKAFLRELGGRLLDEKRSPGVTPREALLFEMLSGLRTLAPEDAAAHLLETKADLDKTLLLNGYQSGHEFYVEMLSQKIALFAYAFDGKDVVYRTTDYKSNEYEGLSGGKIFEQPESNPMLGFRGVSRSIDPWEIEAFVRARDVYGAENLHIMFPFVRTEEEIVATVAATRAQGLKSGDKGLKVFVMAEIPSVANIPLTFLKHVDGFSIGSNDLTQGMLMTDRDSAKLQRLYDEEDPAVVQGMLSIIFAAVGQGKEVGFCGQGVANSELLAAMVSVAGISSASVTPDAYAKVKHIIHDIEQRGLRVADLGGWMNEHHLSRMNRALRVLEDSGVLEAGEAEEVANAPGAAYELIRSKLVAAYAKQHGGDEALSEQGRREVLALKKATKPVLYANTEWREVVGRALHLAGFEDAESYDRILAASRHAHGAHRAA